MSVSKVWGYIMISERPFNTLILYRSGDTFINNSKIILCLYTYITKYKFYYISCENILYYYYKTAAMCIVYYKLFNLVRLLAIWDFLVEIDKYNILYTRRLLYVIITVCNSIKFFYSRFVRPRYEDRGLVLQKKKKLKNRKI